MVARIVIWLLSLAIMFATAGNADQKAAAEGLSAYATLVQELNARRRLNVLYPNPQSPRDGVQVGYVHVGTGHLTFKRRDLVVRANGPVAFARLYDSRLADNADFGPGWRLALAEEVIVGAAATYIDRSGTRHRFLPTGNGYWAAAPPTAAHAGSRLVVRGGEAILHQGDGTVRVFARAAADDGLYQIKQVREKARRLDFVYAGGRLSAISYAGEVLFDIRRDDRGRILAVRDRHGRSVRYGYTAWGSLREVRDLAGNLWRHEYGPDGRLAKAVGANGKPYLRVRHDDLGRAVESRFGRHYAFAYAHRRTTVTAGTGQVRVFEQDAAGLTVRMTVDGSVAWALAPDELGRVRRLKTPTGTFEYRYANDAGAKVAEVTETTAAGRVERRLAYDGAGRLTGIESSDSGWTDVAYASGQVRLAGADGDFTYELSPAGAVTSVADAGGRIDAEYDRRGDLIALSRGKLSVAFQRDDLGRIVETRHANGVANRYFYDPLGNRNRVDLGYGGGIDYVHDAAGNIVQVEVRELDGTTRRQTTQVGEHNRIEKVVYEGGGTLSVNYDRMGNPVRFKLDGAEGNAELEAPRQTHAAVSAEYAPDGRLRKLASDAGAAWAPDGTDRPAADAQLFEDRLAVLLRDASGAAQPSYGPLTFAEETLAPMAADPLQAGVPGLAAARRLHRVAAGLLQRGFEPMYAFEKPSNPAFQAVELRTTNCCIPCSAVALCGSCPGLAGVESQNCYCTSLCYNPFPPRDSDIPAVEQMPFVSEDAFGVNRNPDDSDTLTCTSACGERYHLGGDIFPSSRWRILVATQIKLPGCRSSGRTRFNIRTTTEHEQAHARYFLRHINNAKRRVNVLYDTLSACLIEIAAIRLSVRAAIDREELRQLAHLDFRGVLRRYTTCENGITREYQCGRGPAPNCPGGNRY